MSFAPAAVLSTKRSDAVALRKQYFFRRSPQGLLSWDVDRLIRLTADIEPRRVPLARIAEIDRGWSGDAEPPTWRAMIEHVRLINAADLAYPIILSASGEVMDGMHRVAKALLLGREEIDAVQFADDPPPDHLDLGPDDLPY
jgi:hypothetical protein